MERRARRNPWLAGLSNLLVPGLGFLYLGRVRLALLLPLAMLALIAAVSWSRLILDPAGLVLMLVLYLLLWLGSTLAVVRMARRAGMVGLGPLQRGHVYLGFAALLVAINLLMPVYRATLFGIEAYRVPSNSMADTLIAGDQVMVDSWAYRESVPQRGDVVVFRSPAAPDVRYVKRVIGLPGDVIEIEGDTVTVNGVRLSEPYATVAGTAPPYRHRGGSYVVPPGHYFLLGDNRDHSRDSRYFGYIAEKAIEARVAFIFVSVDAEWAVHGERIGQRVQ